MMEILLYSSLQIDNGLCRLVQRRGSISIRPWDSLPFKGALVVIILVQSAVQSLAVKGRVVVVVRVLAEKNNRLLSNIILRGPCSCLGGTTAERLESLNVME